MSSATSSNPAQCDRIPGKRAQSDRTAEARRAQILRSLAWIGAIFLAGCWAGCTDETSPPCAPAGLATLTGSVVAPVEAGRFSVTAMGTAQGSEFVVEGMSDSTGSYTLAVPPGRYRVRAESRWMSGEHSDWFGWYGRNGAIPEEGDTIEVEAGKGPTRADFIFGGLRVALAVPPGLFGPDLRLELQRDGRLIGWLHATQEPDTLTFEQPFAYPGWIRAQVHSEGWGLELPLPGDAGPDSFLVEAGSMTRVRYSVPEPARIRGSIRGSWQALGYRAASLLVFDSDSLQIREARTDPAGDFQCTLFRMGEVRLMAWAGESGRWIGGESFRTARRFQLVPGADIALDPIVESGLRVPVAYGEVVREDAAGLLLTDAAGIPVQSDPGRTLTLGGAFAMTNLSPGTYYLQVRPWRLGLQEWLGQWYEGAASRETATPIVVSTAGEVVPLTIRLTSGGVIRGRILDGAGVPAEAYVVFTEAGSDACVHPVGRGDGRFSILGLPDGSWKVGVTLIPVWHGECWPVPADVIWYPGTTDWNAAAPIEIREHGTVEGVDLRTGIH